MQQALHKYKGAIFFNKVVLKLEACQDVLLAAFIKRFTTNDIRILWTSLLDPTYHLNSQHWKEDEIEEAKDLLIEETLRYAKQGELKFSNHVHKHHHLTLMISLVLYLNRRLVNL